MTAAWNNAATGLTHGQVTRRTPAEITSIRPPRHLENDAAEAPGIITLPLVSSVTSSVEHRIKETLKSKNATVDTVCQDKAHQKHSTTLEELPSKKGALIIMRIIPSFSERGDVGR